MNNRLKKIASAFAEDSPKLQELADSALHDIEVEKGKLTAEATAIRQLLALAPKPRASSEFAVPNGVTDADLIVTGTPVAPGLSDAVKDRIAALWTTEMRQTGRDMGAREIIDLLAKEGFSLNVGMPGPAVGTVLARVKRDYETNGQGSFAP